MLDDINKRFGKINAGFMIQNPKKATIWKLIDCFDVELARGNRALCEYVKRTKSLSDQRHLRIKAVG